MNRNEISQRIRGLLPSGTPAQRGALPPTEDTAEVDAVIALWYKALRVEDDMRHYCFDSDHNPIPSPTKADLDAAIEAAIEAENNL